MARDIAGDIRLDPRVKAFLADDEGEPGGDVDSREALLAEANSEEARAGTESFRQFMERFDTEEAAPSAGLRIHVEKVISQPDGNTINLQVIRPHNDETLPCVYYFGTLPLPEHHRVERWLVGAPAEQGRAVHHRPPVLVRNREMQP